MPNLDVVNDFRSQRSSFFLAAGCLLGIAISGCGSPSAANTELRKQNQSLQTQIDQLTQQQKLESQALAACERSHPTTACLAPQQLDQLVSTHGLKFGELTGGDNPDATKNSDSELKIYVVPIDGDGVPIKAAGSFSVQAFDLDDPAQPLIGSWTFDPANVRKLFYNQLLLYTYVLHCPLRSSPAHSDLTIRVTFDDLLSNREFVSEVQTKVRIADKP